MTLFNLSLSTVFNTSKFPLSNLHEQDTSNFLPLYAERQTLDHHGHESFARHDFTDIDKIELGQAHLVDARHIPLRRQDTADDLADVVNENQRQRTILGGKLSNARSIPLAMSCTLP